MQAGKARASSRATQATVEEKEGAAEIREGGIALKSHRDMKVEVLLKEGGPQSVQLGYIMQALAGTGRVH